MKSGDLVRTSGGAVAGYLDINTLDRFEWVTSGVLGLIVERRSLGSDILICQVLLPTGLRWINSMWLTDVCVEAHCDQPE